MMTMWLTLLVAALAEQLAGRGHLVVAIDFRGYGASTMGREGKALHQDVLAAVRYARAHGAKTVGVLGASMGGGASARAAVAARAGEIDRLLLLAAVAIENPEAMRAGRFLFVASRDEPMAPSVEEQFARAPEEGMPGEESDLQRRIMLALDQLHRGIDVAHTSPTKQHGGSLN